MLFISNFYMSLWDFPRYGLTDPLPPWSESDWGSEDKSFGAHIKEKFQSCPIWLQKCLGTFEWTVPLNYSQIPPRHQLLRKLFFLQHIIIDCYVNFHSKQLLLSDTDHKWPFPSTSTGQSEATTNWDPHVAILWLATSFLEGDGLPKAIFVNSRLNKIFYFLNFKMLTIMYSNCVEISQLQPPIIY